MQNFMIKAIFLTYGINKDRACYIKKDAENIEFGGFSFPVAHEIQGKDYTAATMTADEVTKFRKAYHEYTERNGIAAHNRAELTVIRK